MMCDQEKQLSVSIITPTFNAADTIQETIASVATQTYANREHLIIDGGSNDDTVNIAQGRIDCGVRICSEPDNGIYDAMNKGLARASGDIIGILNADDVYADRFVLDTVTDAFIGTRADIVYGDVDLVSSGDLDHIVRRWRAGPFHPGSFSQGWHPPHPGVFVRKALYDRIGGFDPTFRIAGDFEFLLRAFEDGSTRITYLGVPMAKMRVGGKSTGSLQNIVRGNRECLLAFRKHGTKVGILYTIRRLLPKLLQYVRR